MQAPAERPHPAPRPRLYFLDNLKVALTALVILHHVGQPYGPGGFWYFEDDLNSPILGRFFYVNASFFMGLFFLTSAYFLPGSYDRKGAGALLKDRFIRLGIPLALFLFTVIPAVMYFSYIHFRGGTVPFSVYYGQVFFGLGPRPDGFVGPSWPDLQLGPLWFIQHLLVYAVVYAAWRSLWRRPGQAAAASAATQAAPPGDRALAGLVILMAVLSGVVRIRYPINSWIPFLGFIQMEPAHMPQYIALFVAGVMAYRRGWLHSLPAAVGLRWLRIGLGAVVIYVLLASVGRWRGTVPPFVALLWECTVAVSLSVGLITLFRERLNSQGRLGRLLGENSYGAYLFHLPVVVAIQYALAGVPAGALAKFLMAGAVAVPLSFLVSHLVRLIPGARSIL